MFLYILNILLGISFAVLFLTGLLEFPELQIIFHLYSYHLPWPLIIWLHRWGGALFSLIVFIHLWLNRRWVAAMTKNYFGKKKI